MKWLQNRLREPSSWAGLATIAQAAATAPALTWQVGLQLLLGAIAVLAREQGAQ